ncbi:unnamed protein product [Effrenium voratum]|nr:unnamed protein product [Effrenium voratum]
MSKFINLPEDSQDLAKFVFAAKPDWSAEERRAVFAKLSAIQIRDVDSLLLALFAEGDQSLNARLRAAGQKTFGSRTLQALEGQSRHWAGERSELILHSTTAACFTATQAEVREPPPGWSESPNWEAAASAGWWRVVSKPSVWAHQRPDADTAFVAVHCAGKLLAMSQARFDLRMGAHWLKLRDERGCEGHGQWIISSVGAAFHEGMAIVFDELLEQVCEPGESPSPEAQVSHHLSVAAFHAAVREKAEPPEKVGRWERLMRLVDAAYHGALTAGCHTFPYARPQHLPAAFGGAELEATGATLVSQGYLVLDDCFESGWVQDFVAEVRNIGESGVLEPADVQQATSGQRDDSVLWIDEGKYGSRWPHVCRGVRALKAIAHALNPALSLHHQRLCDAGEPAHQAPPVAPAALEAVLTVPVKAMLACYPGNGARYIPHTDSKYIENIGKSNPRELTAIIYANPPDWTTCRDGGALRIYPGSQGLEACPEASNPVVVEPIGGRLVVFFSDLWHEVLPAHRPRSALTLWIFRPTQSKVGGKKPCL